MVLSTGRDLRSIVDALANPVTASVGIGVTLLPLTRPGRILNSNRDGEGSPGEEDIDTAAA